MRRILLIVSLFLVLTFLFMYPVILNIKTHIAGFYSTDEPYGVVWSFWWQRYAFENRLPASFINIISAPFGIKVITAPFFPLWGFLVKYIAIISNEVMAYNLMLLSTFILSGITMYSLVFFLSKNNGVSIFCALIYTFCPFHFVRVWQHFGTAQIQWMPLYILSLFKLWQLKLARYSLLLGISLALNYYFDVHYAYFMVVPSALFLFLVLFSKAQGKVKFMRLFLLGIFIAGALIIPALLPFLKQIAHSGNQSLSAYTLKRPFEDLFAQAARPLSYFLPFTEHPIFGKLTNIFAGTKLWGESLTEHNLFLGYIPLILAIIAIRRRKDLIMRFFFFLVLLSWLFSQPPWWDLFGLRLYMPSFFMYKILPVFRAYVRFGIVVMLGISVLAGFGLSILLDRFKSARMRVAVLLLACFLSLYEFWSKPKEHVINLSSYPKVYDWLKEQGPDFVIAEYPLDIKGVNEKYKFYQTKHKKKIINGTIPGSEAHKIAQAMTILSSENTLFLLKWMQVKYILVHSNDYKGSGLLEDLQELENIHKTKGLKLIENFEDIEVYELK